MSHIDQGAGKWLSALIDALVDRRRLMVAAVILISGFMALQVPGIRADVTLRSGINTDSEEYLLYQEFLKLFGNEEFILMAVRNERPDQTDAMVKSLVTVTRELGQLDKIVEIISLANLRIFKERNGLFGSFPVLDDQGGQARLPDAADLETARKALPIFDFLISPDLRTFGIIIRMDDRFRFDPPVIEKLLDGVAAILHANLPPGSDYRIVGAPAIRRAIQKYNIQTAFTFGILCSLICTVVSFYIFKSLRATIITITVVGLCDLWILGIMSIAGIQINSTTALAFGLVLISGVEPVIHLVTHYNECLHESGDRVKAAKDALFLGAVPCLITSFTTAFGFSSLIVAFVPMVRQLGVILSLGPLVAFVLSLVLTPAFLVAMKPLPRRAYDKISGDLLTRGFERVERTVFRHHRTATAFIFLVIAAMLAGAPLIRSDTQILRMLSDSTQEVKDLKSVEANLGPVNSVELLVNARDGAFRDPEAWRQVRELERRLCEIPEVVRVDSPLPLLRYLFAITGGPGGPDGDLLSKPDLVPQLMAMISFSSEGKRILSRYLDEHMGKLHLSVRIRNSPDTTIGDTIDHIRTVALAQMKGLADVSVTGDLVVFEAQAAEIVSSQTYSLLLAVLYMSVLLAIQFRSITLGVVSLFPQLLPQAVIFGTMGWFGISLDSVTVFAASVALGLTVDNTVHFLTQLRRELQAGDKGHSIEPYLAESFRVTARAMISNHAVIFFGFSMLLISPFRPVVCFGILGSAAIFCSLVGDLIFMPSVILSSSTIRKLLTKKMHATQV